jgi:hypothetical protein
MAMRPPVCPGRRAQSLRKVALSKAADELAQVQARRDGGARAVFAAGRRLKHRGTTELGTARREFGTKMSLLSKARDETAHLRGGWPRSRS